MKRYFVKDNAGSMVVFVDDNNRAYAFDERTFDFDNLTLENAKTADYSNCLGCETAEDIAISVGAGLPTYDWNDIENQPETEITEF